MTTPSQVPLFDAATQQTWHERMVPGEYAVHFSNFKKSSHTTVTCTIFPGLAEAEAHARQQVAERPDLRCQIYDHHGLIAPIRDIRGSEYKGDRDLSPRVRRWLGCFFLFGGILLTALDWSTDFKLSWPAMIGTRMLIPGLVLLFTETMLWLNARRNIDGEAA